MNYETYKRLTPELKEEYNWRFKNTPAWPMQGILVSYTMFIMTIGTFLFMCYLIMKDDILITMRDQVPIYIQIVTTFAQVISLLLIGYLIIYVTQLLTHGVQYYIWQKKNKIKYYYWWTKK